MASREPVGAGRVLALVYGFFTLAAGARSAVQLSTHASRAPLAYGLSALAALTYLAGTVAVARADQPGGSPRWASRLCRWELVGVLAVGGLSLAVPDRFPEATVWSEFGAGYGYVPAVLPLLGLLWLRARARAQHRGCPPDRLGFDPAVSETSRFTARPPHRPRSSVDRAPDS